MDHPGRDEIFSASVACGDRPDPSDDRASACRRSARGGKLLLTDGVTSVEGAAGGGLATWALIAGNETDGGIGAHRACHARAAARFHADQLRRRDRLCDRVEISYARQNFDTREAGAALGLGRGFTFDQDMYGAKVRLVGDAV